MERMLDEQSLAARIAQNLPDRFEGIFNDAVAFARTAYAGECRNSGESFFVHALNVAASCADMKLDTDSVIAALLHQTVSKRFKTDDEIAHIKRSIAAKFGENVAALVEAHEQINEATKINKETNAAALTRYLLAGGQDIRPLFIELADALDDARTLAYIAEDKKQGFCLKLLQVHAPLAEYLNLEDVKNELEETAFAYVHPEMHDIIVDEMGRLGVTPELRDRSVAFLAEAAGISGHHPKILGRIKSPYSIWRKIGKFLKEGKGSQLGTIKDLLAFRVVVRDEQECYDVSHAIQVFSDGSPENYDDYIAHPKPNGYRALQITVRIPEISDLEVEIQILTYEMYHYNTYGPAAHVAYKASHQRFAKVTSEFDWIEAMHDAIAQHVNKRETQRSIPITGEIFTNSIFVFTPKGEIKEFAAGDTVLDFAYAIHEDIGNGAVGARVNGISKPLSSCLATGDRVEILVQKGKTNPDPEWLGIAKSRLALGFIRKRLHALEKMS